MVWEMREGAGSELVRFGARRWIVHRRIRGLENHEHAYDKRRSKEKTGKSFGHVVFKQKKKDVSGETV